MATRRTQLDIRTKGGDATKRDLRGIGDSGKRAFDRIRKSSEPVNRGLQILSRTSQSLQRRFRELAGPRGLAALTAAGTGFGLMAQRALATAESISDVSDRTGVGIERLQELRFASDQNGVSFDNLDAGLRRFRRRLDLARDGTGAAADTLEKMGVSLEQDTGAALDEVIRKLGEMARQEDITGEASQLFGEDAGPAMAVLIRQGERGIDRYAERLRELGGIMSDDMVRSAAEASAELRTLRRVTGTAFQSGLIEGFVGEFDTFADAVGSQEFQQGVRSFGQMLGETASFVTRHGDDVIRVMGAIAGARLGGGAGSMIGGAFGRPGVGRFLGGAVSGAGGTLDPEAV
ncbi:hypothetical protein [Ferruginivarius sediminum]|uniref:Phage tail tape measure protein n=1 Tax=Ferruginivarius sediminum TaxID=2661937 RepID=A0A369TG82_9PROT|nr:hypothetical protein [Ferruginivarius sediminum]RDD63822.1 hypothetical protein DRB17_01250 [Ferruginivarius sediminum]